MKPTDELPLGWEWSSLGEACHINERDPMLRTLPDGLRVSFVPMAAVDAERGGIIGAVDRPIRELRKGFTPFANGDVIFARITPSMENGKAAIAADLTNGLGFGSTEFHVMRPTRRVLPEWVFHFVRQVSFRNEAKASFTGTAGQLRVPDAFVRSSPIPLPPLPEQQRLVDKIERLLTQSRTAREALDRIPALLKRFRQAVLAKAFRGELTERDPSDEPASVLLERIREERRQKWEEDLRARGKDPRKAKYVEAEPPDTRRLPELPGGWIWTSVDQLAEVGTGATPLRSKRREYYEGGAIPWITSGALNADPIVRAEEFITQRAIEETNAKVFPRGTLLVAMYGEGQTRGRISELGIDAATNQACAAILLATAYPGCKAFVKYYFKKTYEDIRRLSAGGVQPNLSLTMIRRTRVPLPPLAEQDRIVARIAAFFSCADSIELSSLKAVRRPAAIDQAILSRAFSGKL